MIKIAITGVIGSGKSTLSQCLRNLGYPVADCDAISHAILQPDQAGYKACVEAFGPAILDDQGRIDRAALGAIVFQDAARRRSSSDHAPLIQGGINRRKSLLIAAVVCRGAAVV